MSALTPAFLAKTRETNCTVWIGSTNNKGYGLISVDGALKLAHRVAYEAEYGPIPEGLVIDHLCRVRNCVNPMHLEAVTQGENIRRGRSARSLGVGDVCINGHELDTESIYVSPRGTTECRKCRAGSNGNGPNRRRKTVTRRAERVARELAATETAEQAAS